MNLDWQLSLGICLCVGGLALQVETRKRHTAWPQWGMEIVPTVALYAVGFSLLGWF